MEQMQKVKRRPGRPPISPDVLQRIRQMLCEEGENGRPAHTYAQIAAEVGVSVQTVSNVYHERYTEKSPETFDGDGAGLSKPEGSYPNGGQGSAIPNPEGGE